MRYEGKEFSIFNNGYNTTRRGGVLVIRNDDGFAWRVKTEAAVFASRLLFNMDEACVTTLDVIDEIVVTFCDFESPSSRPKLAV